MPESGARFSEEDRHERRADPLVVDRNPLEDTTTLFEPMLVVTDGRVVLNRLDR